MPFDISLLKNLIAQGETGEAIEILVKNSEAIRSQTLRSEALQLAARWNSYRSAHRTGTEGFETLGVEHRQINQALLELLGELEREQNGGRPLPPSKTNRWKRHAAIAAAVIATLAGIAEITGVSLSDIFKKETPATTTAETPKEETTPTRQPGEVKEKPKLPTDRLPEQRNPTTPSTATPPLPDQLLIEARTNKGSGPVTFASGETVRAYFKVNRPCLLRVIYKLADGRLILFENDREISRAQVGQYIELGDGYEAAEPFGQERMYFFVQSEPFPKLTTQLSEDGYLDIKDGLEQSLRKTRGLKKKTYFAEAALEIETKQ